MIEIDSVDTLILVRALSLAISVDGGVFPPLFRISVEILRSALLRRVSAAFESSSNVDNCPSARASVN
jgi:hypothetical protein